MVEPNVSKNQKNLKQIFIGRGIKTKRKVMDTDKLVKAIQIIVKEEIKSVLPTLVREGVKAEMKKLLKENKQLREALKPQPTQPTFMDSEPVVETNSHAFQANGTQPQRMLSKNPIINEILNQTQPFNGSQHTQMPSYAGAPTEVSSGTMSFNSSDTHMLGASNIAAKMGYGDMMGGQRQGLGIQTGNPALDKAFNRDYSQLVKAMDKKKGPWRPGME